MPWHTGIPRPRISLTRWWGTKPSSSTPRPLHWLPWESLFLWWWLFAPSRGDGVSAWRSIYETRTRLSSYRHICRSRGWGRMDRVSLHCLRNLLWGLRGSLVCFEFQLLAGYIEVLYDYMMMNYFFHKKCICAWLSNWLHSNFRKIFMQIQ